MALMEKHWTKDQERSIMESFRRNTLPVCPEDKSQLQITYHRNPKDKARQQVHYDCSICATHFEFSPTFEDIKWRKMNGGKR